LAAVAVGVSLAGCELNDNGDDLANGKTHFVEKCGACHTMARAGTTGVAGPNLDAAFVRARTDGFGESTFRGVIHKQIVDPTTSSQVDPVSRKELPAMPADLVTGQDAYDVAGYVASAAGADGEDAGRLADIGAKKAEGEAVAQNGTVEIPADPGGSLSYEFAAAKAPAGVLTMKSPNESSIPHNIALEGSGVNEVGEVVQGGGVSEIQADVQPGEYTFYCSVPGHREGGMEGQLTVE
jgi:uncharacterized cupredoxin-like copper-binding protein